MRAAEAGRTLELQVSLVYTAGSRLSRGCTVRPGWKEGREGKGRKDWDRKGGREGERGDRIKCTVSIRRKKER